MTENNYKIINMDDVEIEQVVGEIIRLNIRIAFDNDIAFVPATLPGANNHLTQAATVVITTRTAKQA